MPTLIFVTIIVKEKKTRTKNLYLPNNDCLVNLTTNRNIFS